MNVKETLAELRRGQGIPSGKKVLIVLDQFEQWLHSKKHEQKTKLVQALRQCDGGRVQSIVLVRDDFWMAAIGSCGTGGSTCPGTEFATVDLFDLAMPGKCWRLSAEHLAARTRRNGRRNKKTSSIRPCPVWPGRQGHLGATRFVRGNDEGQALDTRLPERSGRHGRRRRHISRRNLQRHHRANPQHRFHQKAAQSRFQIAAPRIWDGHQRPHAVTARTARSIGLRQSPKDFEELLRILDSEIRLITPTDPGKG